MKLVIFPSTYNQNYLPFYRNDLRFEWEDAKADRSIHELSLRPIKTWKPLVEAGLFRADLLYRLNAVSLVVEPLRHRKNELLEIIDDVSTKIAQRNATPKKSVGAVRG